MFRLNLYNLITTLRSIKSDNLLSTITLKILTELNKFRIILTQKDFLMSHLTLNARSPDERAACFSAASMTWLTSMTSFDGAH